MTSPDFAPYINLTLHDVDEQTIYDNAVAFMKQSIPEWIPREGNTEVLLLEAFAQQIMEEVYAINRLPDSIMEALLGFFEVTRDFGALPTATVTFTMNGTDGYTIPSGTRLALTVPNEEEPLIFVTNVNLVVPSGSSTGTVAVTGQDYTDTANGVPTGTALEILDAIIYADYAALASVVAGGRSSETETGYFDRGRNRLARLTDTLVIPDHFVAAVLEDPAVYRAKALDQYIPDILPPPTITLVASATGGSLAAGTYTYVATTTNVHGESEASAPVSVVIASGTTNSIAVNWTAVVPVSGGAAVSGYKVYGRVSGAAGLLASVAASATTWTDTGSVAPGAAPPTANTTQDPVVGNDLGHITIAMRGLNANLSQADKNRIKAALEKQSVAMLSVHIIDPKVTTVNVTTTVMAYPLWSEAAVRDNIQTALADYLNTNTWDWSGVVRRNELIQTISNAPGVDYVVSLTVPAADVTLAGVASLASLGTTAITVNVP